MRFYHADDHVFAAAATPDSLTQHLVSLADARRVAEEQLKNWGPPDGGNLFKPLVWSFVHLRHSYLIARKMSNPATIMRVKMRWLQFVFRYTAVTLAVVLVAWIYRHLIHVNPTTVALTFLLLVLVVSTSWGLRCAIFLALLATLAFNFYFLPPVGTFTISDPQNWVALFAFLATAILAGELSDRARRETANANHRRRDVERLYSFSQRLLATDNVSELLNAIPSHVCQIFGGRSAAMYLLSSQETYRSDHRIDQPSIDDLKMVSTRGELVIDKNSGTSIVPLRLGTRLTGAIGVAGMTRFSRNPGGARRPGRYRH